MLKRIANNINLSGFILGILGFLYLFFFPVSNDPYASNMAAVAVLMATWWMTEAIPISATALIPIVLFPFLGILDGASTAINYMNSTIFLFLGGFMIAIAMEKWNLHKRIALGIINLIGSNPIRMISGFMFASFFLSMIISNTATTIMMLPIALAIILKIEEDYGKERTHTFSLALMLGIAYASSAGGTATLVGTVPNLAFKSIYEASFPNAGEITFANWLKIGLPISISMLLVVWLLLNKKFYISDAGLKIDKNIVKQEIKSLGKLSYEEICVLSILLTTAALWIFRSDLDIGILKISGWGNLFQYKDFIDDGTVAILTTSLFFIIPSLNKKGSKLLNTDAFKKLPWDIIVLFGGGFALAKGFDTTGLSEIIGAQFSILKNVPVFFIALFIALMIIFLTELTSNTATIYTMLPILASISVSIDVDPKLIMIPATFAASYAFMLPVATPPNAIVFSSKRVEIKDMVKVGFWLNIIGAFLITILYSILNMFE